MFSGWGIRTLAASHPSYHPFSYHLGSVWPVEQATIAAGFGRYGLIDELHQVTRGFFDLAALFEDHRIPESVGGIARDAAHAHPGIYPKADSPQAWSASGVVMMVQALLGLRPLTPAGVVAVDPHLPEWLPTLALRNARLGHTVGDLHFWRDRRGRTRFRADVPGVHVVRMKALRLHRLAQSADLRRRADHATPTGQRPDRSNRCLCAPSRQDRPPPPSARPRAASAEAPLRPLKRSPTHCGARTGST
jgi:hypothetical protein